MNVTPEERNRTISYFVNGETEQTSEHELTVAQILESAGFTPYQDYQLTRDDGHHTYSNYEDKVPIREGERFTATFTGPTPTS